MERRLKIEKCLRKFTKRNLLNHVTKLQMFNGVQLVRNKKTRKVRNKTAKRIRKSRSRNETNESNSSSSSDEETSESDEETSESDDENDGESDLTKLDLVESLINRLRNDVSTEFATSHLDLIGLFLRRTSKNWRLFQMTDSLDSEMRFEPSYLERKLRRNLEVTFNANVAVQIHDGAYWIRIALNQRGQKNTPLQREKIVYAVHYSHISYVGVTEIIKKHSSIVLDALTKLFGYREVNPTALVDRNVVGLFQLAHDKGNVGFRVQANLENPLSFSTRAKNVSVEPAKDERIRDLDAKQKEERDAYNRLHFGSIPLPPIQQLTYKLEAPFEGEDFVPSMSDRRDKPFQCKLVFEGKDVCTGIQELVRLGIATIPLPKHLADVRILGRNHFLIRKKKTEEPTKITKNQSK